VLFSVLSFPPKISSRSSGDAFTSNQYHDAFEMPHETITKDSMIGERDEFRRDHGMSQGNEKTTA